VPLPAEVEDALRRSGVIWVGLDDGAPRAVWQLWHDGAVHLVAGGAEQELPRAGVATRGVVQVRGRTALSGLVATWEAVVERLEPRTAAWDAVTPLLAARRLNAEDAAGQPDRWAHASVVLRLTPVS
jgi:hypothetical protein